MKERLTGLTEELETVTNKNTIVNLQLDQIKLTSEGLSTENSELRANLQTCKSELSGIQTEIERLKQEGLH